MTEQNMKWNEKPLSIILLLLFFFPLGLYFMWKNEVFSKTKRWIISIFLGFVVIGNMSSSSSSSDSSSSLSSNDVLIEELTNGSFIDGPKFNKNGTFSWVIEDGPEVSGNYKIGKFTKSENERGYKGMRHLSWWITFSNVSGSEYWDDDNSMILSYDWNHPRSKKKLILKGKSSYYPIEILKVVSGNKLIENYWNEKQ
jgi:hypothetical protein|tara:strand:- start:207 stop:800 length:594 start_codon:yes stop_codon:yes gene_type:complete